MHTYIGQHLQCQLFYQNERVVDLSATVLYFLWFDKLFRIHVDASAAVLALSFLKKRIMENFAIIANFSKRFTLSQQHYSAIQKECLAVVLVVSHWRSYVWGR